MSNDIIRREAQRDSNCRGCDKDLVKGDDIIYTYSMRNRGQNIIFCIDCAVLIGKLAEESDIITIATKIQEDIETPSKPTPALINMMSLRGN